jgi:hypothetical protein
MGRIFFDRLETLARISLFAVVAACTAVASASDDDHVRAACEIQGQAAFQTTRKLCAQACRVELRKIYQGRKKVEIPEGACRWGDNALENTLGNIEKSLNSDDATTPASAQAGNGALQSPHEFSKRDSKRKIPTLQERISATEKSIINDPKLSAENRNELLASMARLKDIRRSLHDDKGGLSKNDQRAVKTQLVALRSRQARAAGDEKTALELQAKNIELRIRSGRQNQSLDAEEAQSLEAGLKRYRARRAELLAQSATLTPAGAEELRGMLQDTSEKILLKRNDGESLDALVAARKKSLKQIQAKGHVSDERVNRANERLNELAAAAEKTKSQNSDKKLTREQRLEFLRQINDVVSAVQEKRGDNLQKSKRKQ